MTEAAHIAILDVDILGNIVVCCNVQSCSYPIIKVPPHAHCTQGRIMYDLIAIVLDFGEFHRKM